VPGLCTHMRPQGALLLRSEQGCRDRLCDRGARACRAPFLREKHNSTRSPEEMARAVLFATGPWLLRDAFRAVTSEAGRLAGGYAGAHTVRGTRYMVYELGQWCATGRRARRTRGSCGRAQAVSVACL